MTAFEVNYDGLVGPTYNYGGLAYGNVASMKNAGRPANPRAAARQGLEKMKALGDLGLKQGILPPQERPDVGTLRRLGFIGTDAEVLRKAFATAPELLHASSSASSMWTANAATVSPSADTRDGRVHFTPANLSSKFHRSIEPATTAHLLKALFPDDRYFCHHAPLPSCEAFGDEGAANHTRLCHGYGRPGVELFVYGREVMASRQRVPATFPARQTLEASQAIARLHRLPDRRLVFARQRPEAIDAGVFHNDVVAVGNRHLLLYHEKAFVGSRRVVAELQAKSGKRPLLFLEVKEHQVSLGDAVRSYLFNSQLLSLPSGDMLLVAPRECRDVPSVRVFLEALPERDTPILQVRFFDLRQSMRNGGGPACLRLRVVLTETELAASHPGVLLTDALYDRLVRWVDTHYRDRIHLKDLADPKLLDESRKALDELTQITRLGSVYPFQQI